MRVEIAQLVKAPREKVFEAWTDYEGHPRWDPLFMRVAVTKREGNTVHLATQMKVMGRKVDGTEKHVLTPPEEDRSEAAGESSAARSVWKFEPVPEGTRVTWTSEIELGGALGKLFGPFAKRRLQAMVRQELRALEEFVVRGS